MAHFVLMLALILLLGCEVRHNVLVVGLDGADWDVLDPLIEGGHVPTLAALVRGGARADLDCTASWPEFSCFCPAVWVSIATGQPESVHGIRQIADPPSQRRVPALWNLVDAAGGWSSLSSWRNTDPPEEGHQFVLTENGNTSAGAVNFRTWGSPTPPSNPSIPAMPDDLYERLGLLPFTTGRPGDVIGVMAKDRVAMMGTQRVSKFTLMLSGLIGGPSLTMITIHSVDKSEHVTWAQVQDETGGPIDRARIDQLAAAWTGPVFGPSPLAVGNVVSQYIEADRWLGELLEKLYFRHVLLVSDHGMARNTGAGLSGLHGPEFPEAHVGILVIAGEGVVSGSTLHDVDVLDVAPTVAWLLGIPVAEDLPGRTLTDAFDPAFLDAHPIDWTPSWKP
jgi:hypothetical protein